MRWLMVLGVVICCSLFAFPAHGNPRPGNDRVNQDTTGTQQEPSAASFGMRVYVGWKDWRSGVPQCWFAYSSSLPDSWLYNVQMAEPIYTAHTNPCLAVNEQGILYYALAGFDSAAAPSDIFVFTSTDNGLSFGPPVLATPGTPNTWEARPWIAARGDTVYLTYHSFRGRDEWPYRNGDIYFTRSTDRGQNFLPPIRVNDNPQDTTGRGAPTVAVASGGLLYVVWSMDTRNAPEVGIYSATSTDGGRTFGPNNRVIPTVWLRDMPWRAGPTAMAAASRDSGYLYIVWADQRDTVHRDSTCDVWFTRSTNRGITFNAPICMNLQGLNPNQHFMPAVMVSSTEAVHVNWYDPMAGLTTNFYYVVHAQSANHGTSFAQTRLVSNFPYPPHLDGPSGNSMGEYISLAERGGQFSSFWTDFRLFGQDIYTFAHGDWMGVEKGGTSDAVPQGVRLEPILPNPVKDGALIAFSLSRPAITSLRLYDISGRRVKILTQSPQEAGYHVIRWDGDDEAGHPVPSGIYFYRLNAGNQNLTRRLTVVR